MPSPVAVMLQKEVLLLQSEMKALRRRNKELRERIVQYEMELLNMKRIMRDHFDYVVRSAAWVAIDENEAR